MRCRSLKSNVAVLVWYPNLGSHGIGLKIRPNQPKVVVKTASKAKYRVTNWPKYDAALVRRGNLTVWFTEEAVAAWHAPATGKRGGQPIYSATAIETGLALRLVFHQSLRQTEGLLRSIADVLGMISPSLITPR